MRKSKIFFMRSMHRLQNRFLRYFALAPSQRKKTAFLPLQIKGSALIMAAMFMLVASVLIVVGAKLVSNISNESKKRETVTSDAENVARAGLIDAEGWFQRQAAQPVMAFDTNYPEGTAPNYAPGFSYVDQPFNPVDDLTNAQESDTKNAALGIVNDYPLDDPVTAKAVLWGRYEVLKVQDPTGATKEPYAARDISGNRIVSQQNGDGIVWSVTSTGYVYRRLDKTVDSNGRFTVAYNQPPNQVISTARLGTEFRKLALNIPSPDPSNVSGAVYCDSVSQVIFYSGGEILLNGAVSTTSRAICAMK